MCGIAGIVEYGAAERTISHALLQRMSDVIAHRGPDDEGQWLSRACNAGFAFRRLAIVDLSPNGHQPMTTPDGRFTIVFNGEIYNHRTLRAELERKGYRYRSQSDTETLLYGYAEWGADLLEKLVGMWGLAIWDEDRQELFCARDRIGIKPLYYTQQQGRFLFASEIKSLFQHPAISATMNAAELPNYLSLSMTGRSTLFQGIHKLPPAHWLKLRLDGTTEMREYWNVTYGIGTQPTFESEEEIRQELMRLLRQAVKDRMMSDVPFGVFLSGGIDSSTNVALMAELMNRPVDTFSVGFKELEQYNEMHYARRVATLFGTNHHEILIDHNDALEVFESLAWHEDEPNGDPVCIPLNFVSKLTRASGTIVVQVGEGSDEQFAGYSWMHRDLRFYHGLWRMYAALPKALRLSIYALVKPLFLSQQHYLALDYLRRGTEGDALYWGGALDLTPVHLQMLFTPRFRHHSHDAATFVATLHADALQRLPKADYLQQMAYIEFAHRLPELLLMRVDKISMAHGLEARVPFLDHRLVEFTMTLPERVKVPRYAAQGGETKHLLKKAVETLLPHDIIYRKKQGFAAPVSEWFRKPLRSYWESEVFASPLVGEVFDREALRHFFTTHTSGKRHFGKSLYTILNLVLWHKRYIR